MKAPQTSPSAFVGELPELLALLTALGAPAPDLSEAGRTLYPTDLYRAVPAEADACEVQISVHEDDEWLYVGHARVTQPLNL